MRKRPSLFNYATDFVARRQHLLCLKIDVAPEVINRNNPLLTIESALPVLGTNEAYGLNFCFQLSELKIDFHPETVVQLPPELNPPLTAQHFAIGIRICGGIGCPQKYVLDNLPQSPPREPQTRGDENPKPGLPPTPLPTDRLECFCIDLFITGHFDVTGPPGNQVLSFKLDGLEIVDIKPDGLENSLECYFKSLIHLVVLPRMSFALENIVFDILKMATVALSATPAPAVVPNNPAIENDQLKVFINAAIS
jgi:hypothetical protein